MAHHNALPISCCAQNKKQQQSARKSADPEKQCDQLSMCAFKCQGWMNITIDDLQLKPKSNLEIQSGFEASSEGLENLLVILLQASSIWNQLAVFESQHGLTMLQKLGHHITRWAIKSVWISH